MHQYLEEIVSRLFYSFFGRHPDARELDERTEQYESYPSSDIFILDMVDELIASDEYLMRFADNQSFQSISKSDVFYAFKFLLGRLPESQLVYDDKIRLASTYELIDEIVSSDEFKHNHILKSLISIRRKPKGLEELQVSSSGNKINILVLSGCQGRMIADLLQAGGGFSYVENAYLSDAQLEEFVQSQGKSHEMLLSWADVIYTQKAGVYEVLNSNEDHSHKTKLMPLIEYAGLQPDLCNLVDTRTGAAIVGPMGEYQSLILTSAYFAGISWEQALDAFNENIYSRFGFDEIVSASKARILDIEHITGYPLQSMSKRWDGTGKWMRTYNHPKKLVLADLVRFALDKEGISPRPNFDEYVIDDLADNADWPGYGTPSLSESKTTQPLYFKKPKAFSPLSNSAEFITISEYSEMFYRSMEGYTLELVSCLRLGREIDLNPFVECIRLAFAEGSDSAGLNSVANLGNMEG